MKATAATLVLFLAAPPLLPAGPQDPTAGPLTVAHTPVGCMVAGTSPQLEAAFVPESELLEGRLYFKSAMGDAFYYVDMTPDVGQYLGVLPKPRPDAQTVSYYIEGIGRDSTRSQTPVQIAVVVDKAEDCREKVAALGPMDPVRVYSTTGGTGLPPGFTGVASVVAGRGASAAAAAAAGGVSKTALIVAGGVGAGVIAIIVATGGGENPPASPIR